MVYLSNFKFPDVGREDDFIFGQKRTCYDTYYPFQILSKHNLTRLDFEPVTILYGGNGSGKTTALNVIAENWGWTVTPYTTVPIFLKTIQSCVVMKRNLRSLRTAGSSPAMTCLILC